MGAAEPISPGLSPSKGSFIERCGLGRDALTRKIVDVLLQQPDLSLHGFWCTGHPVYPSRGDHERDRVNMLRPEHVDAFRWARTVLRIRAHAYLPAHSSVPADSFFLRMCMDDAGDVTFDRNTFVEEGTVIAAALALGFRVDRRPGQWSGFVHIRTERPEWLP